MNNLTLEIPANLESDRLVEAREHFLVAIESLLKDNLCTYQILTVIKNLLWEIESGAILPNVREAKDCRERQSNEVTIGGICLDDF